MDDSALLQPAATSRVSQVWIVFGVGVLFALAALTLCWVFLHRDDLRFINYAVALVPVLFSILFGFIPDVRERHVGWRIAVIAIGLVWSVLLGRSQLLSDREQLRSVGEQAKTISAAVDKAVEKANVHSDDQTDKIKKEVGTQVLGVRSDLGATNTALSNLSTLVQHSETDLSDSISKVKMPPSSAPHVSFSVFSDTLPLPIIRAYVRPGIDEVFLVDVVVTNDSDAPFTNGELWFEVCSACSYAKEPDGFDRPKGMNDFSRHKGNISLNPGVTWEKMTLPIKFTAKTAAFEVSGRYACTNCPKMSATQTLRIYTLPSFSVTPINKNAAPATTRRKK